MANFHGNLESACIEGQQNPLHFGKLADSGESEVNERENIKKRKDSNENREGMMM
jgi:hypothetical protein